MFNHGFLTQVKGNFVGMDSLLRMADHSFGKKFQREQKPFASQNKSVMIIPNNKINFIFKRNSQVSL
jgi:hypothetical protein